MTDPYDRYTRLRFDRPHPKVLRITMDNGRMNTTDEAMHAELAEIWRDVDRDPTVNAAVIAGAGKVFSAGGDFAMIRRNIDDFEARARQWRRRATSSATSSTARSRWSARCGASRSAPGSCAASSPTCRSLPRTAASYGHTRLGVAAGDHAAIIWPLLCGLAKAKYYLLLCEPVLGAEAERIGLISLAVEDGELDAKAVEIAARLAEGAQSAIRWTKYALNNWLRSAGPAFDASLALEFLGFTGPEVAEGLASHLEKRKPAFPSGSVL
jgi:enoyl-CoA hydratase